MCRSLLSPSSPPRRLHPVAALQTPFSLWSPSPALDQLFAPAFFSAFSGLMSASFPAPLTPLFCCFNFLSFTPSRCFSILLCFQVGITAIICSDLFLTVLFLRGSFGTFKLLPSSSYLFLRSLRIHLFGYLGVCFLRQSHSLTQVGLEFKAIFWPQPPKC